MDRRESLVGMPGGQSPVESSGTTDCRSVSSHAHLARRRLGEVPRKPPPRLQCGMHQLLAASSPLLLAVMELCVLKEEDNAGFNL